MPHLISNLVEKSYTPFTAKLAPRHLWSKPTLGRKPQKVTRLGADPTWKASWRFIRSWVCHNHKLYYTYVLICTPLYLILLGAFGVYQFWWYTCINYYKRKNYHRSIEYAILKEQEWQLNKPKEEDEEEEEVAAAVEGAAEEE